jgi:hypothetical protein
LATANGRDRPPALLTNDSFAGRVPTTPAPVAARGEIELVRAARGILCGMRFRCAFVMMLGCCGTVSGQQQPQLQFFHVKELLAAHEDKTGCGPGEVQPLERLARFFDGVLAERELEGVERRIWRGPGILAVEGDQEARDLVQSVVDQLRCEQLPRLHLECTVLEMPVRVAKINGIRASGQVTDLVAMTALMKDVVKAKGVLLNLPEIVVTPLVPFARSCIGAADKPPPPNDGANLWLQGEAVVSGPEEALFRLGFSHGSKGNGLGQAFRLQVGHGVAMMTHDGKMAKVVYLRFTGISNEAPKTGKPGSR